MVSCGKSGHSVVFTSLLQQNDQIKTQPLQLQRCHHSKKTSTTTTTKVLLSQPCRHYNITTSTTTTKALLSQPCCHYNITTSTTTTTKALLSQPCRHYNITSSTTTTTKAIYPWRDSISEKNSSKIISSGIDTWAKSRSSGNSLRAEDAERM